jgi:hypothetical protein
VPAGFRPRAQAFPGLRVGSVNACGLTKRAPDKWESARFQAVGVAQGWFRQNGVILSHHLQVTQTVRRHAAFLMWVRKHIRVVAKIMSIQSCPPSAPLPFLFFLVVESLWSVLAISFSVLKFRGFPYFARFARWSVEHQRVCADRYTKMVLVVCLPVCHNLGWRFARSVCPRCFNLASKPFPGLELGPVNACRLTKRAPDKWESARFQALCLA